MIFEKAIVTRSLKANYVTVRIAHHCAQYVIFKSYRTRQQGIRALSAERPQYLMVVDCQNKSRRCYVICVREQPLTRAPATVAEQLDMRR
jgi:hypothetical protein